MSNFVYSPLAPLNRQIRLVRLFGAEIEKPQELGTNEGFEQISSPNTSLTEPLIYCEVFHGSLNNPPSYCALSYSWGNPNKVREIVANGARLPVTENLEIALHHLRPTKGSIDLWIDAISINQDDDAEKSEQIEQMRQIYSSASSVIAWLGVACDNSNTAMKWMREYGKKAHGLGIGSTPALLLRNLLKQQKIESKVGNGDSKTKSALDEFIDEVRRELLSTGGVAQTETIVALTKLLERPYWSRVWVVQEVVSASNIEFVCGTERISEDALHYGLRLLRNARFYQIITAGPQEEGQVAPEGSLVHVDTRNPVLLLKLRRSGGPFPLLRLLRNLRNYTASDPRDKVYALLGISSDAEELQLHPDYRKSWEQGFTSVAEALFRRGDIELFTLCSPFDISSRLPSWIPDWTKPITQAPFQRRSLVQPGHPLHEVLQPKYAACRPRSVVSFYPLHEPMNYSERLQCQAFTVGTIQRLGTSFSEGFTGCWFEDIHTFFQLSSNSESKPKDARHSTWRTAAADQESLTVHLKSRLTDSTISSIDSNLNDKPMVSLTPRILIDSGLGDYYCQVEMIATGRRPVLVTSGHVALVSEEALIGDQIVIFTGAQIPHVLRPKVGSSKCQYHIIGETYVHGIMDGEAFEQHQQFQTIFLV